MNKRLFFQFSSILISEEIVVSSIFKISNPFLISVSS